MSADADIELAFYEKFFIEKNLEPYPVQEQAFAYIFAGHDVMVTVPTGTGKTMMAKAAIFRALRAGKTAVYTTPLRALTEEKFRELSADFGDENVGFATGDYKVNTKAPIQVLVAEILWNRIYGDRVKQPADIVVMDEGHYFNDPERGYVWEQSIIGLDPRTQLIVLSATVGYPERFTQWVYLTRRSPMQLVRSTERKVPLLHQYREQYMIETVKELYAEGDYPAIIFGFSRKECFERARILKSCPRFTTDEERAQIELRAKDVLFEHGLGPELKPLLLHGIGVHHAGILPRYRRLVEELTLDRLLKFVASTETISAGINLPAKRALFPSLRKFMRGQARILRPAEYHQMAGRAGRPQFDKEGVAITLAPEEVVQEFRKEIKDQKRGGYSVDEEAIKRKAYMRAKQEARAKNDVIWDKDVYQKLIDGQPAALTSQTRITAEQILAIGLPDLAQETLPGVALIGTAETAPTSEEAEVPPPPAEPPPTDLPAHANLNIRTVIDNLLLPDLEKRQAHRRLAQITANLQALGVLDEHGRQVKGEIIGKIRGMDGPFIYYALMSHELVYEDYRQLIELLVDHDVIHRALTKKDDEKKKEAIRALLRELRRENSLITWEDAEAEYEKAHPRPLSKLELIHQDFLAAVPHQELHGGKVQKAIWAEMEDNELSFEAFVDKHDLAQEEGSLFTYLARVMKAARMLREVTEIGDFEVLEGKVRQRLAAIDDRVLEDVVRG